MRNFYLFSVIQIVVSAEKTCSNSFRNETIDCSDDEPQGLKVKNVIDMTGLILR